jgi:hypothetical protein
VAKMNTKAFEKKDKTRDKKQGVKEDSKKDKAFDKKAIIKFKKK